eukprot:5664160-Pleurochrysis_carterae.AAC.2
MRRPVGCETRAPLEPPRARSSSARDEPILRVPSVLRDSTLRKRAVSMFGVDGSIMQRSSCHSVGSFHEMRSARSRGACDWPAVSRCPRILRSTSPS